MRAATLSALLAACVAAGAARAAAPPTIPALRHWSDAPGEYVLRPSSRIVLRTAERELSSEATLLAADLGRLWGRRPRVEVDEGAAPRAGDVELRLGATDLKLGREGYALTVGPTLRIEARSRAGVFYGTRTLLQRVGRYWHAGADEYLGEAAYASYPQLERWAERRHGAGASGPDAYLDFINWVDRLVRSGGRTCASGTTASRAGAPCACGRGWSSTGGQTTPVPARASCCAAVIACSMPAGSRPTTSSGRPARCGPRWRPPTAAGRSTGSQASRSACPCPRTPRRSCRVANGACSALSCTSGTTIRTERPRRESRAASRRGCGSWRRRLGARRSRPAAIPASSRSRAGSADRPWSTLPPVKLYVCWGTFRSPRPGGHPCRNALEAMTAAGWEPEVERVYGLGVLGSGLNPTRAKVRELTGQNMVPVLVTDDGEVIQDSRAIIEWARQNPAAAGEKPPA